MYWRVIESFAGASSPSLVAGAPGNATCLCLPTERLGQLVGEPRRLADPALQVFLEIAELADLIVRPLEGLQQQFLRDLPRPGLDHGQRVLRADDDQVERAVALLHLGERRVD